MKRLTVTMIIILVSLSLVYLLFFSSVFSLKTYDVDGVKYSSNDVKMVLDMYKSKNLFLMNTDELREDLINLSFVKTVMLEKKYPSTIKITINERIPVGQLEYKSKYMLISDEFIVLDIGKRSKGIPLFSGFEHSNPKMGEELSVQPATTFERAKSLAKLLQLTELSEGRISYKDKSLYYYINDNYYVDFGKDGDISEKFTVFMTYYEEVSKKQGTKKGVIRIYDNKRLTFQPFEEEEKKIEKQE